MVGSLPRTAPSVSMRRARPGSRRAHAAAAIRSCAALMPTRLLFSCAGEDARNRAGMTRKGGSCGAGQAAIGRVSHHASTYPTASSAGCGRTRREAAASAAFWSADRPVVPSPCILAIEPRTSGAEWGAAAPGGGLSLPGYGLSEYPLAGGQSRMPLGTVAALSSCTPSRGALADGGLSQRPRCWSTSHSRDDSATPEIEPHPRRCPRMAPTPASRPMTVIRQRSCHRPHRQPARELTRSTRGAAAAPL